MHQRTKQRFVGIAVVVLMLLLALPLMFYQRLPGIRSQTMKAIQGESATPMREAVYELPIKPLQSPAKTVAVAAVPETVTPAASEKPPQKTAVVPRMSRELPPAWTVQVASFSHAANAQHLLQALREQGLLAYTRREASSQVTQVFVGPYIKKADAEARQHRLQQQMNLHGVIRRYRP